MTSNIDAPLVKGEPACVLASGTSFVSVIILAVVVMFFS